MCQGLFVGKRLLAMIMGMKRIKISDDNERDDNKSDTLSDYNISDSFKTLKHELQDLQFIVGHLKEDISCTIENGQESLKTALQSEISLLVYSLMEESIREQIKFKESLTKLEEENAVLLENEGAALEEMAKLTLENEALKSANRDTVYYTSVIEEAKKTILETFNEVEELEMGIKETTKYVNRLKENHVKEVQELTALLTSMKLEIEKKNLAHEEAIQTYMQTGEQLKVKITERESKISELLASQTESETRMRELLSMNCELMDMSENQKRMIEEMKEILRGKDEEIREVKESYENELDSLKKAYESELEMIKKSKDEEISSLIKAKDSEISSLIKDKDSEISSLIITKDNEINSIIQAKESEIKSLCNQNSANSEIELLKKTITAQKIELERTKETLVRERKISSLKISDLREQLAELKGSEEARGDSENIEDQNDNNTNLLKI